MHVATRAMATRGGSREEDKGWLAHRQDPLSADGRKESEQVLCAGRDERAEAQRRCVYGIRE